MTKRRIIYLLILALSLVSISFVGGTISYGFFFAAASVPVIDAVYITVVYFRFRIYQKIESRTVVAGKAVPYYFLLKNEDVFTYSSVRLTMDTAFSTVSKYDPSVTYSLSRGDEVRYNTILVCKYRGEYEVGIKYVTVSDPFAIFRLKYKLLGTIRAIVKPRIADVNEFFDISGIDCSQSTESILYKTEPDISVREYVTGDALKLINWKAYARTGKLMTREQYGEEKHGVMVFFNAARKSKKAEEYIPYENKVLEVVIAIIYHFANIGIKVDADCFTDRLRSFDTNGMDGFEETYEKLSELHFSGNNGISMSTLESDMERFLNRQIVFFVTDEITKDIVTTGEYIYANGTRVTVLLISDGKTANITGSNIQLIQIPVKGTEQTNEEIGLSL